MFYGIDLAYVKYTNYVFLPFVIIVNVIDFAYVKYSIVVFQHPCRVLVLYFHSNIY